VRHTCAVDECLRITVADDNGNSASATPSPMTGDCCGARASSERGRAGGPCYFMASILVELALASAVSWNPDLNIHCARARRRTISITLQASR